MPNDLESVGGSIHNIVDLTRRLVDWDRVSVWNLRTFEMPVKDADGLAVRFGIEIACQNDGMRDFGKPLADAFGLQHAVFGLEVQVRIGERDGLAGSRLYRQRGSDAWRAPCVRRGGEVLAALVEQGKPRQDSHPLSAPLVVVRLNEVGVHSRQAAKFGGLVTIRAR